MDTRARTLDAVLCALGEALTLESELGTRAVEIDRALLSPLSYAKEPERVEPKAPAPKPEAPALEPKVQAPEPKTQPAPEPASPDIPLYAFLSFKQLTLKGLGLLGRMVTAMNLPEGSWTVECLARCGGALPPAKVYILLGRDTQKALLPSQPALRGHWVEVAGVPAISTYSPDFILDNFGDDPAASRKVKLCVWGDLKSALARLGRTPRTEG